MNAKRSRFHTTRLLLAALFLLGHGCAVGSFAWSQTSRPSSQPSSAPHQAQLHQWLASKQYKRVQAHLQAKNQRNLTDEELFLLGRTQFLQKQYLPASKTLLSLSQRFPASRYRIKSVLQAADALARAKQHKQAYPIYAAHLKRLFSPKRKLKIARVYLEYADKYYALSRKTKARIPCNKAIRFYKLAERFGLPKAELRRVLLRLGLSYQKSGNHSTAKSTFQRATKRFPKGPDADKFAFHLTQSMAQNGDTLNARLGLEDFLKTHAKSPLVPKAYLQLAASYGLPGKTSASKLALGLQVLQRFLQEQPKAPLARKASFWVGSSYFNNGRYDDAIRAFQAYVSRYTQTTDTEERWAARARYQIALCSFRQKKWDLSIRAFQTFLKAHPADQDWPKAQRNIVAARFQKGEEAFARAKWEEAHQHYQRFLRMYPLDPKSPVIWYRLGRLAHRQKQYKRAIRYWQQLIAKYPKHKLAGQAIWSVARTYRDQLNQPNQAIQVYQLIAKRRYYGYGIASNAIRILKSKSLQLLTPRVFHTGEKAALQATLRNIKEVKVRLYQIDPVTYFRKMHTFRGMENLDYKLIRPDHEWTVKAKKYEPYKIQQLPISLPLKKASVAVVHVTAGEYEATTVAVISDVQIITKANRNALFVFALHSKTKKPVANAKVLVSDGNKLLFEKTTKSDGSLQIRSPQLKRASSLRVLALANGSVASSDSGRLGSYSGLALQPTGLLYSERPLYQPGETVYIKGILREINANSFQIPTQPYTLELRTPTGKLVYKKLQKPSAFGGVDAKYQLEPNAQQGRYSIIAYRQKGARFVGHFLVRPYTLPKYRLRLQLSQRTFMRNQTIQGTFLAEYGFGAPAANKTISYRLGSISKTGVTNARGELAFSFPTRALDSDRTYFLSGMLSGNQGSTRQQIWLRSTEFDLGISTQRKVYAAGESFDIKLRAADPSGKRYPARVQLRWFRRYREGQRFFDKQVGKTIVQLDKNGAGRHNLSIAKGGLYLLRADTMDAKKQPIVASLRLFVSGDQDKQVLRLLSKKDTYHVGESTKVRLLSRRTGTALVTWEGEHILAHRLIPTVQLGETLLPLQFSPKLSPNFALHVVLLHKQHMYQVRKAFVVQRKLHITLKPRQTQLQPGHVATVEVETRDQAGKPVAAEVSVAVVNQLLFSLHKQKPTLVSERFYRFRRSIQFATHSSHTYKHKARTQKIESLQSLQRELRGPIQTIRSFDQRYAQRRIRATQQIRRRSRRNYRALRQIRRLRQRRRGRFRPNVSNAMPPQAQTRNNESPVPSQNQVQANRAVFDWHSSNAATGNKQSARQETSLARSGFRRQFATTAYWNAKVNTNAQGRALVTFTLPENAGKWRIHARGVAHPTLVGEATQTILTKKPFFVEVHAPSVLSEGDKLRPRVVIHNQTQQTMSTTIELSIPSLGQKRTLKVQVAGRSSQERWFPKLSTQKAGGQDVGIFVQAQAKAGKAEWTDKVEESVHVRLPGVRVHAARAGMAREKVKFSLKLPGTGPRKATLKVNLGAWSPRWILELVRELPPMRFRVIDNLTAHAQLLLTALDSLKANGQSETPEAKELLRQLQRKTMHLWSLANQGWGLTDKPHRRRHHWRWRQTAFLRNPLQSAETFMLLMHAHKRWNTFVSNHERQRTRNYLKQSFRKTTHDETKVRYLAALTTFIQGDRTELFAYSNRLFRKRNKLSLRALSSLGLTWQSLQRNELAKQIARLVEARLQRLFDPTKQPLSKPKGQHTVPKLYANQAASVALSVEFLSQIGSKSPWLAAGVRWLMKQRRGLHWSSMVLTSQAVRALASYYKTKHIDASRLKLTLVVNGKKVATRAFQPKSSLFKWQLYTLDSQKPVTIEVLPEGIGAYRYAILLEGTTTHFRPSQDTQLHYTVKRSYTPALRQIQSREIAPGFSVLAGNYKRWTHQIRQLSVGDYSLVKLRIRPIRGRLHQRTLLVEEPIPGGAIVLPSSIQVPGGSVTAERGKLLFFLPYRATGWTIQYRLYGSLAGQYQIPPTRVWSFQQPEHMRFGTPYKLHILPQGTPRKETYEWTPDELMALGKYHFTQKRWSQAQKSLTQLVTKYTLRSYHRTAVTRMLLQIAFKLGPNALIIRYFEQLKERNPDAALPLQQVLRVGQAYAASGEHERAYMVYQAVITARFFQELYVASIIEKEKQHKRATQFIRKLHEFYPDLRSVQESLYALAQSSAQRAESFPVESKKRATWLSLAETQLRDFLWMYPDHPTADTASYALANVFLDQKKRQKTIDYLRKIAKQYPKSRHLEAMHYLEAYALYLQRKDRKAIRLLTRVSKEKYPDGKGGLRPSENRYLAAYLIGQICHARGLFKDALVWYKYIQKRFPDAATQVDYFQRKLLQIPEVSSVAPKQNAQLKLRLQNIKTLAIRAYYVDLMKLYLLKRNLNNITRINLAGIRPFYTGQKQLAKKMDFSPRSVHIPLPLRRKGSYLLVAKSKTREVSGILLRTSLRLEVQQDPVSGRVTVHAFQKQGNRPAPNVIVRVVGSQDKKAHRGKTDLRGIFTATNIHGTVTVLAQKGDDFAFFRGKKVLQKRSPRITGRLRRLNRRLRNYRRRLRRIKRKKRGLLDNIMSGKKAYQSSGRSKLESLYLNNDVSIKLRSLK